VFEGLLACGLVREGVAEIAAHLLQDTSPQQKLVDRFRLAFQDFVGQIVEDEVMAARKALDEARRVICSAIGDARLERKRGHLQTGDPTLGVSIQGSDLGDFQVQPHQRIEKRGRFLDGEAQIPLANLGDLAASTQSGKRQRRIVAGDDDHVYLQ
jgi:hypothetical protein